MPSGDRVPLTLASAAAAASAVTTFLLWWLPRQVPPVSGFEDAVALHLDAAYTGRLAVNLIHVFLALAAYGATAAVLRRQSPVSSAVGFISFSFWAFAEALGVAINLFAVNRLWRAAYSSADEPTQALIRGSIHTFGGIWEGIFFVVLATFLVGTIALGLALFGGDRLQRTLAVLFLLAAPLTVVIMMDSYFGFSLSGWIQWTYPVLQPISRLLLGIWLLRMATQRRGDAPEMVHSQTG